MIQIFLSIFSELDIETGNIHNDILRLQHLRNRPYSLYLFFYDNPSLQNYVTKSNNNVYFDL